MDETDLAREERAAAKASAAVEQTFHIVDALVARYNNNRDTVLAAAVVYACQRVMMVGDEFMELVRTGMAATLREAGADRADDPGDTDPGDAPAGA